MIPHSFELELPIYPNDAILQVDRDIATAEFACDLNICKGACCTIPGAIGAPILPQEISILEQIYPLVKHYLPQVAINVIEDKGIWYRDTDGTFSIETVGGNECVFVMWDGDVAHCAIQRAYLNKEITGYAKPISCHLFPIRLYPETENNTSEDSAFDMLYVEANECEGGRVNGKAEHTSLFNYLKEPLTRAIGSERYEQLRLQLATIDQP